jgi:hypothetical membrane protein
MRIEYSSLEELPWVLADPRQTPPDRTRSRRTAAALLGAPPLHLALLALTVLLTGIGVSIASTTDPQWWQLHFSRLGTFHNSSGAVFNITLIAGGTLVALFARAVGRELRALERRRVRRGTARTAQVLLTLVGVNLALVGCVPLNVNQFVHDHVAAGMVLSFAGLLLTSPWMMHRMPKRLLATTAVAFVCLFAGGWLFVTATINLALFEVIGFSAMFAWSGIFVICLARVSAALAAEGVEPIEAPPVAPLVLVGDRHGATDPTESAASPATNTAPAAATAPAGIATRAVTLSRGALSRPRGDEARVCWADADRRRPPRVLRSPHGATRPASRRDARGLPRRGCTGSAARAASGR